MDVHRDRAFRTMLAAGLLLLAVPASAADPQPATSMRQYVLALLYKGPSWAPATTPGRRAVQAGHLANIDRLVRNGSMALAGPTDGGELRGIFILNVANVEDARALIAGDPAIAAGQLRAELHLWYGPAAVADAAARSAASGAR